MPESSSSAIDSKIRAEIFARLGLSFTQTILDYIYAILASFSIEAIRGVMIFFLVFYPFMNVIAWILILGYLDLKYNKQQFNSFKDLFKNNLKRNVKTALIFGVCQFFNTLPFFIYFKLYKDHHAIFSEQENNKINNLNQYEQTENESRYLLIKNYDFLQFNYFIQYIYLPFLLFQSRLIDLLVIDKQNKIIYYEEEKSFVTQKTNKTIDLMQIVSPQNSILPLERYNPQSNQNNQIPQNLNAIASIFPKNSFNVYNRGHSLSSPKFSKIKFAPNPIGSASSFTRTRKSSNNMEIKKNTVQPADNPESSGRDLYGTGRELLQVTNYPSQNNITVPKIVSTNGIFSVNQGENGNQTLQEISSQNVNINVNNNSNTKEIQSLHSNKNITQTQPQHTQLHINVQNPQPQTIEDAEQINYQQSIKTQIAIESNCKFDLIQVLCEPQFIKMYESGEMMEMTFKSFPMFAIQLCNNIMLNNWALYWFSILYCTILLIRLFIVGFSFIKFLLLNERMVKFLDSVRYFHEEVNQQAEEVQDSAKPGTTPTKLKKVPTYPMPSILYISQIDSLKRLVSLSQNACRSVKCLVISITNEPKSQDLLQKSLYTSVANFHQIVKIVLNLQQELSQ